MKIFYSLLIVGFIACSPEKGQKKDKTIVETETSILSNINNFDSKMANQLGANKYGLKKYTLCFFNKGAQRVLKSDQVLALEKGHINYMNELIAKKEIVLAGYFNETDVHLGFVVFDSQDTSHVRSLIEKDPKVNEGLIVPHFQQWTSSAAILKLNEIHQKIQKTPM